MTDKSAALDASNALLSLFESLGSRDDSSGTVYAAYRVARAALAGKLEGKFKEQWFIATILQMLRGEIEEITRESFEAAIIIGQEHAEEEIAAAGLPPVAPATRNILNMVDSVTGIVDSQITSIQAALILPDSESLILGDGVSRLGILSPGSVIRELDKWIASLQSMIWEEMIETALLQAGDMTVDPLTGKRSPAAGVVGKWGRVAVAVLDERTTQTCRLVDGQTAAQGEPFTLRGTPRYADQMMHPPFHEHCRTTERLVRLK